MKARDFIPTYFSNRLIKQYELESKAIEKINQEKLLTEEEKTNAKSLIYGGMYRGAIMYIFGCREAKDEPIR